MKRIDTKDLLCEQYDSITEFTRTTNSREPLPNSRNESDNEHIANDPSWYGVDSAEQADDYLVHGYKKASDKLLKCTALKSCGTIEHNAFDSGVVGCSPIVPNAILGVPNSMLVMKRTPKKAKVVRVLYDISHSCGVKSDRIINQGAELLNILKQLERAGYSTELSVMEYVTQHPRAECFTVVLKRAGEAFDVKKVSYPIVHTAMLRVHAFKWYERVTGGTFNCGYGVPLHARRSDMECRAILERDKLLTDNAVYVNDKTDISKAFEQFM